MIHRNRRAVTLVELLVSIGLIVVVMGLALGIMEQTRKASRRVIEQQAALQYSQQLMVEVTDALASAVSPAEIDPAVAAQLQGAGGVVFSGDRVALPVLTADGRLTLLEISSDDSGVVSSSSAIASSASAAPAGEAVSRPLGGRAPEGVATTVSFAFAANAMPGQRPTYSAMWRAAEPPALVRVTVSSQTEGDRPYAIELQTAVVLGGLRARPIMPPVALQVPAAPAATPPPTSPPPPGPPPIPPRTDTATTSTAGGTTP